MQTPKFIHFITFTLINTSTTKFLAQALSALLHPLMMPTLLHLVLFGFAPSVFTGVDETTRWRLLLVIFILTFLLPLLFIYFLLQWGFARMWSPKIPAYADDKAEQSSANNPEPILNQLQMQDRTQRFVPFLFTTFIYGADTFLFTRNLSTLHLSVVILGAVSVSIGLVTVITLFWKISAHAVGIGGLMGFLLGIAYQFTAIELLYPTLVTVLVAGLLSSARLYLNAHTLTQVGAGFLLGLVICFSSVMIWG